MPPQTSLFRLVLLVSCTALTACGSSFRMTKIPLAAKSNASGDAPTQVASLRPGEKVLVCLPADGSYGEIHYKASGASTQNSVSGALTRAGLEVVKGALCTELAAAITQGKEANARWIVLPNIEGWEDRATEWSGRRDRINFVLQTIDALSGIVVDSSALTGSSTWWTLGGDHPQDLLEPALKLWVVSITSK